MSNAELVRQSKSNILVVDDKSNNLKLLFQYLQDAEYKVLIAQDGRRALEVAKSIQLDLIILDIMMSGISGFETCLQFKKNPDTQDIPIIFMTALAETDSKVKGFELGAVDYITKPFDREELITRVNTQLTVQKLHQRLNKEAKNKQILLEISDCIRQSLDLNSIFQIATKEIHNVLNCDSVVLARLSSENILIENEFVVDNTVAKLPQKMAIEHFFSNQQEYQDYRQGQARIIEDVENKNSHLKAIQAQLVIPILLKENGAKAHQFSPLWGWLVANQDDYRRWQPEEIELCQNVTTQLAIAIKQGLLYQQVQQNNQQLQKANKQFKQLAWLDPLTQIFNRRYFDLQINKEWLRLKRNRDRISSLSLILCNVDYFKLYNDTYGHQQGNECLKNVASALGHVIKRPADILARYGGEEFVIILPDTPLAGAIQLAEAMRVAIKDLNIPHSNSSVDSMVTISLGIASIIPNLDNTPTLLIEEADRALYLAKNNGRDCFAFNSDIIENN